MTTESVISKRHSAKGPENSGPEQNPHI